MASGSPPKSLWRKSSISGPIGIPERDPNRTNDVWFRKMSLGEAGLELSNLLNPGLADITCSIQISHSSSTSDPITFNVVKAAVRQLRFDHPGIAMQFAWRHQTPSFDDAIFAYEVPSSEADVDEWLSKAVVCRNDILSPPGYAIEDSIRLVMLDLASPAKFNKPIFLVHYIPSASPEAPHALVFLLSHAAFDGIGAFQIMDLCVERIAAVLANNSTTTLAWGEEISRLPVSFQDASVVSSLSEKKPEDDFVVEGLKKALRNVPDAYQLPIPFPDATTTTSDHIDRVLSPDLLASLYSATHSRGVTIFGVLWAATVLSLLRIHPPPDPSKPLSIQNLSSPVNIRKFTGDIPEDKSSWAVRLSTGVIPYSLTNLGRFVHKDRNTPQLVEDVWTIAREIKQQTDLFRPYMRRIAVWGKDYMNVLMGLSAGNAQPTKPTEGIPLISSLGVMDKYLAQSYPTGPSSGNKLVIKSPRMGLSLYVSSFGSLNSNHTFTWGGELVLGFTWPQAAMGSLEDQQKRTRAGDQFPSPLRFIEEFMAILNEVARCSQASPPLWHRTTDSIQTIVPKRPNRSVLYSVCCVLIVLVALVLRKDSIFKLLL